MNPETQEIREAELKVILDMLCPLLEGTNPMFIPCPLASKKASIKYQKPTPITHDNLPPFYLERLCDAAVQGGNLAVLLGPVSGNLCTFDIDRDELVEPFLKLNPRLCETLCTKGQDGCNFWFKHDGDDYPQRVIFFIDGQGKPVGEWRGGNCLCTIYGVHESSARKIKTYAPPSLWLRYRFLVEKPIITIRCEDIVIPKDWDEKVLKPGEPYRYSSNSDGDSPDEEDSPDE
jgi:hypothetical protein